MKLEFLCVDIPLSKIEYAHLFLAYALFLLITVAGILIPVFKKIFWELLGLSDLNLLLFFGLYGIYSFLPAVQLH